MPCLEQHSSLYDTLPGWVTVPCHEHDSGLFVTWVQRERESNLERIDICFMLTRRTHFGSLGPGISSNGPTEFDSVALDA